MRIGGVGGLLAAPLAHRQEQLEQPLLHLRRDAPHHPHVDQPDAEVRGDEHVAGVRVGVEEAVHQDLLEVGAEQFLGERAAVHLHARQRAELGDLFPRHVPHGEHARGGVVPHGAGHHDAGEVAQVLAQRGEVLRLGAVVQLGEQRPPELGQQVGGAVAPAGLGVAVQELGDVLQRVQVGDDLLADARALHLDGHLRPVAQAGAVHLPQRGGGQRLRVEVRERLGHAHAQLGRDDALHLGVRERGHVVLEPGQRLHVRLGQEVGAGGQELSELDVGGPQPLQVVGQLAGHRCRGRRRPGEAAALLAQDVFHPGVADQVGAAVLDQESADFYVSLQVLAV